MKALFEVELAAGEILIIREALTEATKIGMPPWKYELITKAMNKLEDTYEKPKMEAEEVRAELEKERKHWEARGKMLAAQMAVAKKKELRFWNEITGEGY